MNPQQLVCGLGFNRESRRISDLVPLLGYSSYGALLAERNYLFMHDRYCGLSVNDIVEIYAVLGAPLGPDAEAIDLVINRLNTLESQLEETINPILIGGYKLEIRGIYENHLASAALVSARLAQEYGPLRDVTNESMIMLETGAVSPADFLRHAGVSGDEKTHAIAQRLIPADAIEQYLAEFPRAADAAKIQSVHSP
ncbi:MAG: hypothetical protein EXR86_11000 [Gammaproteobacteria bacterium]|nr:hypothetical protein [Gammaproteobacteria bacterium]